MTQIPRPKSRKVQKSLDETRGSLDNFHWKPMRCYKPWMWFATSCFRQSRTLPWKFKNAFQRHVVCWRRRLRSYIKMEVWRIETFSSSQPSWHNQSNKNNSFLKTFDSLNQFSFGPKRTGKAFIVWESCRCWQHGWFYLDVQPVLFVHEYQRRDDVKSLVVTSSARIRFIETWDKAEIKAIMSTFLRGPQLGSAQDNWCSWVSKYPQNIFHLTSAKLIRWTSLKVSLGLADDEVDGPKILHGRNADLTCTEFLNPDSFPPPGLYISRPVSSKQTTA